MVGHAGRARALAALASALVIAVPAASSATTGAGTAPPPVALAGETTVVGDRSASVRVRVPRPAKILNPFGFPNQPVPLTSNGRGPTGFALVSDKPNGLVLIGSTAPPGTELTAAVMRVRGPVGSHDGHVVPAGNYRLYLITEHRSARLRLRLHGLAGKRTVSPRTPTQGVFETPEPVLSGPPSKSVYTAGETTNVLGTHKARLTLAVARHQIHTETVHSYCGYKGRPAGPAPYLPGCPGGLSRTFAPAIVSHETADGLTHGMFAAGLEKGNPGGRGTGYSMTTATPAELVAYQNMWLSLVDPEDD